MTGAYLRVKRNGKWDNIEVEHLTDDERRHILSSQPNERLLKWLDLTCKKLQEQEQLMDELVLDGVLTKG